MNRSQEFREYAALDCHSYVDPPAPARAGMLAGIGLVLLVLVCGSLALGAATLAPHGGTGTLIGFGGTMKELTEARNKLEAKRNQLAAVFAEAKVEGSQDMDFSKVKSLGDGLTTLAKVDKVGQMNVELNAIFDEVQKLATVEQAEENLKRLNDNTRGLDLSQRGPHRGDPDNRIQVVKSLGELFIESKAFKNFERGSNQGPVAALDAEMKTLMTTSAGWAPQDIRTGIVTLYPTRPAPDVVDFIPQVPTAQSAVVYMEETTFTNNAVETTQASTYGEAALALTERSQAVRKVAIFLPVTDEQLEDVPFIQAYINQRLTLMLRQRVDSQVLVGDGLSTTLLGTENVVGIQTQALGSDPIPDAILKLFTKIRDDGYAEPDVVFIRPSKWQTVALQKTADGIYIWGHPSENGPTRIWGVPVKQTNAVTSTKAVAGDYQTHSMLAIKRGIDFQISNSHSTYFVEGKQAIRADIRVAMVHLRPKAFGTVTGL